MENSKSGLNPVMGIIIALISMYSVNWLVIIIIAFFRISFSILPSDDPKNLMLQIFAFYIFYFGLRIPGTVLCGYILAYTRLKRKYLTAVTVVLLFYFCFFILWLLLTRSWSNIPKLNPIVPLLGKVLGIILLCPFAVLGVYWPQLWERLKKNKLKTDLS